MKKNTKNAQLSQTNIWDMWNELDLQDAKIKNVALAHYYGSTDKQKADTKRMLQLLQEKYLANLKLLDGVVECWGWNKNERL